MPLYKSAESKINFSTKTKTYVVGTQKNRLNEMVLYSKVPSQWALKQMLNLIDKKMVTNLQ